MNTVRRSRFVQKRRARPPGKSWTRTTWRCKRPSRGLDISFDHYSRTSSPKHHEVAQDFFLTLLDKGGFEVKTEEQFYDEEAQQFLADRYIQGTCPSCGHDGAYGDQCEKCGKTLSPTELVNPRSTLSGSTPVLKPTTLWYLPMGRHEDWLREYIVEGTLGRPAAPQRQGMEGPRAWDSAARGSTAASKAAP